MSNFSQRPFAQTAGTHHARSSTAASFSFTGEDSVSEDDHTLSFPSTLQNAEVALPRVLNHAAGNACTTPTKAVARWPQSMQRRCGEDSTMATGTSHEVAHQRTPHLYADAVPSPDAKQHLYMREELEPNSLFSSRNRGGEMSSFGISVSTTTAAAGSSASTMPTRWLRSADLRALGVSSESNQPNHSPRTSPESVFERSVQQRVVRTAAEDEAMMRAALHFAEVFA